MGIFFWFSFVIHFRVLHVQDRSKWLTFCIWHLQMYLMKKSHFDSNLTEVYLKCTKLMKYLSIFLEKFAKLIISLESIATKNVILCRRRDPPPVPSQPPSSTSSPSSRENKENDSPLPKYKRDLVQKMKVLRQELQSMQPQAGHCRLEVSREEIFEVLMSYHISICES